MAAHVRPGNYSSDVPADNSERRAAHLRLAARRPRAAAAPRPAPANRGRASRSKTCCTCSGRAVQQFHTYPPTSQMCLNAVEAWQRALVEPRSGASSSIFRVMPRELIVDEVAGRRRHRSSSTSSRAGCTRRRSPRSRSSARPRRASWRASASTCVAVRLAAWPAAQPDRSARGAWRQPHRAARRAIARRCSTSRRRRPGLAR